MPAHLFFVKYSLLHRTENLCTRECLQNDVISVPVPGDLHHLVVKPSTGKASAFWGNTEVFVDGSAQHDTITMLKDGKIGEFEASSLQVMLFIEYICAALKQLIETLYNF